MMDPDANVMFDGASFSFLSYEVMNSVGDQEGFLLGEVTTKVTDSISDSQLNYKKKETVINVESVISCDVPFLFYDGQGRVDEAAVRKIVGDRYESIVGWYHFRRDSTLQPFLRERSIHKNLQHLVPQSRQPFFLLGLLTVETTENQSTHNIDQRFFCFSQYMTATCLSVTISCLGDTSHSEYRTLPASTVDKRHNLYDRHLSSLKKDAKIWSEQSSSLCQINAMHSSFQNSLKSLCERVSANENQMASLQEEIRRLKADLGDDSDEEDGTDGSMDDVEPLERLSLATPQEKELMSGSGMKRKSNFGSNWPTSSTGFVSTTNVGDKHSSAECPIGDLLGLEGLSESQLTM